MVSQQAKRRPAGAIWLRHDGTNFAYVPWHGAKTKRSSLACIAIRETHESHFQKPHGARVEERAL